MTDFRIDEVSALYAADASFARHAAVVVLAQTAKGASWTGHGLDGAQSGWGTVWMGRGLDGPRQGHDSAEAAAIGGA